MGDDIARLKQAGDSLMAVLREMDGLVWYLVLCLNKAHAADIPDWSLTRLLRKMEGPEWN